MFRRPGRQSRRNPGNVMFTPASLPGLIAWFRADKNVTLVSSHVSAWGDLSGNGNNLAQGTAGNRPTVTASWTNGKPGVAFVSASTQFLQSAAFAGGTIAVGTVFCVFSQTGGDQFLFDGRDATNRWFCDPNNGTGAIDINAGVGMVRAAGGAGYFATPRCGVLVYAGASSAIWVNGALVGTTGNSGTNALAGITLACGNDGATAPMDGTIGELAVYSQAFGGTGVAQLETYAQGFWGVP